MQYRLFCFILCAGLTLESVPALSHEFWVEPEKYQVASGAGVVARLRNGQEFKGAEQPYLDHRIARFEILRDGTAMPYQGRMGDMPAFTADTAKDGLIVLVHQTRPQTLTYETWEEFQAFVDHKGFGDIRTQHLAMGFPDAGFTEQYTRYAKSLVAIGDGAGSDQVAGFETEIIALANPYTDNLAHGLPVQVLYQGNPRPRAQVEIFAKAPDGSVTIRTQLTDEKGETLISVVPEHVYLLDSVVLRPAPEGKDFVWQSLWAAMTFAVPAR